MEEQQQSRMSQYIGIGLIAVLMFLWFKYAAPTTSTEQTTPEVAAEQAPANNTPAVTAAPVAAAPVDTAALRSQLGMRYGAFAPAATGTEQIEVLENELVRIEFTSKGGRIKEVLVKNYLKVNADSTHHDIKTPLRLLEDAKNRFDYTLAVANAAAPVSTADLYFRASKSGNSITFSAPTANGGSLDQVYTLQPNSYQIDYRVGANNLQSVLVSNKLQFQWDNYLDKLEKNQTYERTMSSVYYKINDKGSDYCNCQKDDRDETGEQPVKWFAHSNQFFNTAIVAQDFTFRDFVGETRVFDDFNPDLKLLRTSATVPLENLVNGAVNLMIYTGPNEFERLRGYHQSLEDIIPFGSSLFGTINRWIVHPLFAGLLWLIGVPGLVILLMTLIVKLLLYPLTYRMVYSQAKMAALKPQIDALRKKFGDDQQQMSMETMKLYSEFKVNPLGGCLPVFLQMPIWFALYRFFPAAIEFRQASFLWATDLSSYDVAWRLPFMLPGFGNHISAFTIIWVITTLWYTWYSMKQMDNATMNTEQAKIMKYMQFAMPVMFMFFFNTFAAGLTCYLCFSNLLNVGQTVFTKRFLIDNDKIKAQLEANRAKPKKEGGWRSRLEEAMKEQQRLQAEKDKKKK